MAELPSLIEYWGTGTNECNWYVHSNDNKVHIYTFREDWGPFIDYEEYWTECNFKEIYKGGF